MLSIIALSCIIAQTAVAIYLFNTLNTKDDFDKRLNVFLVILLIHLGSKLFMLIVLKSAFLYNHNATGFSLAYGPILYLITRIQVRRSPGIRLIFLHMFPFFLFTLLYFINFAGYVLNVLPQSSVTWYAPWYHWLVAGSLVVYPIVTLRLLKGIEAVQVRLLRSIAYIILGGIISGLLVGVYRFIRTGVYDFDLRLLPYLNFILLPVVILRYRMRSITAAIPLSPPQPVEQPPVLETPIEPRQYKNSILDNKMMDHYEILLRKFIEKSKIYLQADISLEELAAKVKIPKHHLTQLLNKRFEKNFYTFINEYRIKEAIAKLDDPDEDVSILSLAYDCGFNSKSSFNSYFKKVTNHTPSAYRKVTLLKFSEEEQTK